VGKRPCAPIAFIFKVNVFKLRVIGLIAAFTAVVRLQANGAEADQFQEGTLQVERFGDHGTPVILIPGLASGAWVWRDTVERLKKEHRLFIVTLAGFDGRPALAGPLLEQADQSLLDLIVTHKMDRPVLIGHSLGGTLSIKFAEEHSALISGVLSVDGLPIFPGTEQLTSAERLQMAQRIKTQMSVLSRDAFAAQQMDYMQNLGVLDAVQGKELAKRTAQSDPVATADYMAEDLALDLRPGLPLIQVPLLIISPYNAPDFTARQLSEAAKTAYYKSLLSGAPRLQVVSISPARHFVMFDQPAIFGEILEKYLKSLEKP